MKLSVSVVGQIVLGVVAIAGFTVLGYARAISGEAAAAGVGGVFLALMPGISSGHAVDVKTLFAELAPVFAHLPRVSSVTVDRTTTVTKSVSPPAEIPVHEAAAPPSTPEVPHV